MPTEIAGRVRLKSYERLVKREVVPIVPLGEPFEIDLRYYQ